MCEKYHVVGETDKLDISFFEGDVETMKIDIRKQRAKDIALIDAFDFVNPAVLKKRAVFDEEGEEIEDFWVFYDFLEFMQEAVVIDEVEKVLDIGFDDKIVIFDDMPDSIDGFERRFVLLVGVAAVAESEHGRKFVMEDLLDDFGFRIGDGDAAQFAGIFGDGETFVRSEIEKIALQRFEAKFMGFVGDALQCKYFIEAFIKNRALHLRTLLYCDVIRRTFSKHLC